MPVQVFDPRQEWGVVERRLPHWSQAGTLAFVTWRTWDSIPKRVLETWLAEREEWLRRVGADGEARGGSLREPASRGARRLQSADGLTPEAAREFQRYSSERWNEHLDACHGECVLRRSELSQIVADSLLSFDGDRYELTDFVVMPNHVHLLAAFPDEVSMLRQCDSWKHFTAVEINRALGRRGRFWQQDGFDHLVRSLEQFERLRRYIGENPRRARLGEGEFRHWAKVL